VSSLEEISIFTMEEDLPLGKVFDRIHEKENGGLAIDYKLIRKNLKRGLRRSYPNITKKSICERHKESCPMVQFTS